MELVGIEPTTSCMPCRPTPRPEAANDDRVPVYGLQALPKCARFWRVFATARGHYRAAPRTDAHTASATRILAHPLTRPLEPVVRLIVSISHAQSPRVET